MGSRLCRPGLRHGDQRRQRHDRRHGLRRRAVSAHDRRPFLCGDTGHRRGGIAAARDRFAAGPAARAFPGFGREAADDGDRFSNGAFVLPILLLAAIGPSVFEMFDLLQLSSFAAMALAVLGLAFVWGYLGVLSLGHAAFFGLGAYAYAITVINLGESHFADAAAIALPALFSVAARLLPVLRTGGRRLSRRDHALRHADPLQLHRARRPIPPITSARPRSAASTASPRCRPSTGRAMPSGCSMSRPCSASA